MNRLFTLMTSVGLGAGLMYFYDPSRGRRRRALVRDQVNAMLNETDEAIDTALVDLRNRTRGILAEGMARLSDDEGGDWLVAERVRAALGPVSTHPGAIRVQANGGQVTLHGPILADEVDGVISRVARVRGVKGVDNQLEVHEEPGNIPALQGKGRLGRGDQDGNAWSPSLRLLAGVGGGALALYGGVRRGLVGTALSVTGLGLVARGVSNLDLMSLLGKSDERQAIRLHKGIQIDAPVEQVYTFWANFENFPKFMEHVKEVRDLGNGRSHWVVSGPAGQPVEWDAIVTREAPNQEIGWESVAGSEVKTAGQVRFRPATGGGTNIDVLLGYTPPAGALGHVVASLFGKDPKKMMDDDLARLKTLFEQGKTRVEGRKLTGQDLAGASSY